MSKLEINGISKSYGKKVLFENLSLSFETGHCYALLGRNGAGKSTLINIIMQRAAVSEGKVLLDGKSVSNNDALLSRMFCMNDSTFYPPEFRLKTVFKLTAAMYEKFDKEYADRLAELFGLDLKKRAGQLSTGYSTVYKVILALASNADFIFLDEPVLGLDVNMRELFYRELAKKMSESDSCFVISTHIIEEIPNLVEKAVIIHNGKVLVNEDVDTLLSGYMTFSGMADIADSFAADKNVIGTESMSVFRTVTIKTDGEYIQLPEGLNEEELSLQKLFYFLTGGNPF